MLRLATVIRLRLVRLSSRSTAQILNVLDIATVGLRALVTSVLVVCHDESVSYPWSEVKRLSKIHVGDSVGILEHYLARTSTLTSEGFLGDLIDCKAEASVI